MDTPIINAILVFRPFSTRYFGICQFFVRYCGIGYHPMSPSIFIILDISQFLKCMILIVATRIVPHQQTLTTILMIWLNNTWSILEIL